MTPRVVITGAGVVTPLGQTLQASREALGWSGGDVSRPLGVLMGTSGHDLLIEDLAAAVGVDAAQRAVSDIPWFAERVMSGLVTDRLRWTVGVVSVPGVPHVRLIDQIGNALAATVGGQTACLAFVPS